MTITAVPPQRQLIEGETSSEVTSPLLLPTSGTAAAAPAVAAPGSGHRAVPAPRPRWFVPALAAVVVAALLSTGVGAYLLGAHASDRGASAPTSASGPARAAAAASAPAVVHGPRLVDAGGAAVDAAVAEQVRAVYAAMQSADLAAVKRSYSASGSDDWLTVKPRLDRAPVRVALLNAMRTAPTHRGGEYRYRSAGYSLTVQQSGSQPAGLVQITGPWTTSSSAASSTGSSNRASSTGSSRSTSTPRRSSTAAGTDGTDSSGSCAAGTTATSTRDYPCRDNATGTGVYRDGTVGVHGLKPCPPGTVVPSDPNKPTRNRATGAMCAYDPGSG